MNPKVIEKLKLFGVTDYEAKAYSALVSLGTASVTEVSQLCDVPRPNLYGVLESLASKGFVDIQKGRPILFKALEPKKVLEEVGRSRADEIKQAQKEIIDSFSKAQTKERANIEPALIWGVKGYNSVMNKIEEIIKRSKKDIMINVPDISAFDKLYDELKKARQRKVKIRIACEERGDLKKYQKIGTIRVREKIHGIDIVADDSEILIAPPLPIVAAWMDNPEMALHVKDFLELVWKDATVLK